MLKLKRYREIFDFPVIDYYKRAGFDLKNESFKDIANEFIMNYNARRHECLLQPGAVDGIIYAAKKGIGQSLLSASHQNILEEMIEYHNLGKYFTFIKGIKNHYAGGKIKVGEKLLEKIGVSSSEILLIGDTTHDYYISKLMNCHCILVSNGHQSPGKLQNCKTRILSSLEKLLLN